MTAVAFLLIIALCARGIVSDIRAIWGRHDR